MSIAITTTYHGPTTHRGSRIIATAGSGTFKRRKSFDYHELEGTGVFEKHATAAQALAKEFAWTGEWVGGDNGDSSYVFVRRMTASFIV